MRLSIDSTIKLNNGVEMPVLGFGTWSLSGGEAIQAALWALQEGYRLIDTAASYENEEEIGQAIKESGILRDDVFVTTKVWYTDQGFQSTLSAFERSLKRLDMEYIDLYLIHWPRQPRRETWGALEKIYKDGRARAIGVSNFTIRHLDELMGNSSSVPSVNQVEFTPFFYQKELLEYCETNGIVVEAYCPLTRGQRLAHPCLQTIGRKYEKSSAQILLRWGLQHNIIQIPKSGNKRHIRENSDIFDFSLNDEDMKELDNLNEDSRVSVDLSED